MNALLRGASAAIPGPLFRLASELSGRCSILTASDYIQRYPDAAAYPGGAMLHYLRAPRTEKREPHPLFDTDYYLRRYPDVARSRWHPLLHFVAFGGAEGRSPHPLFDSEWYVARYPEVAAARLNPLQHYIHFGAAEGRSPHPLFDPQFYLDGNPDVPRGVDPLVHFILHGAAELRDPHPLFSTRHYMDEYPQVRASGMNPLVHFLEIGAAAKYNPHPSFDVEYYAASNPHLAESGLNPLVHYVLYGASEGRPTRSRHGAGLPLTLRPRSTESCGWRNGSLAQAGILPVFVVYGPSNADFLANMLIPALRAQELPVPLSLNLLNYREPASAIAADALRVGGALESIRDWSDQRPSGHWGFGQGINYLFNRVVPKECFLVVNPDSFPLKGCLRSLCQTYASQNAALVEARQWPLEHPKEFDANSGATPWASGAFLLVSAAAFRQLGGFDPVYFLYNEDVDLSWRAWLNDMPVHYDRSAMCAHFTGLLSYRNDRFYYEQFLGARNFLVISYKFFGERGEAAALSMLRSWQAPAPLKAAIEESYNALRPGIRQYDGTCGHGAAQVKIVGFNLYHELANT